MAASGAVGRAVAFGRARGSMNPRHRGDRVAPGDRCRARRGMRGGVPCPIPTMADQSEAPEAGSAANGPRG
jgi:hypothetical protein